MGQARSTPDSSHDSSESSWVHPAVEVPAGSLSPESRSLRIPSLRGPCFLLRLADVELECVCHGLEVPELLRLARCHRRLRAVLERDHAWAHSLLLCQSIESLALLETALPSQEGVDLESLRKVVRDTHWNQRAALPKFLAGRRAVPHASPLLRRAHVTLMGPTYLTASNASAMAHMTLPLWHWDAHELSRADHGKLQLALSAPVMGSLRVLQLFSASSPGRLNADVMRLICALPRLLTLSVASDDPTTDHYALLASAPQLTSLQLCDSSEDPPKAQSYLAQAVQCPQLKRLHVHRPVLHGGRFAKFCAMPLLGLHLRELTISEFNAGGMREIPASEYAAGFSALHHLETLRLLQLLNLSVIVPHAACAPALRLLIIQPKRDFAVFCGVEKKFTSAPFAVALGATLSAAPKLHCILMTQLSNALDGKRRQYESHGALQGFGPRLRMHADNSFDPVEGKPVVRDDPFHRWLLGAS